MMMNLFEKLKVSNSNDGAEQASKIFLSHHSDDKVYGDVLRDLIVETGLENNRLIYTSSVFHGIPAGENLYDYLGKNLAKKPVVLFLLSNGYFDSIPCLNEMGATWVTRSVYYTFFVPGFDFSSEKYLSSCIDSKMIGILLNGDQLCRKKLLEFIVNQCQLLEQKYDRERVEEAVDDCCRSLRQISVLHKECYSKITKVKKSSGYIFCRVESVLPTGENYHEDEAHWLQMNHEHQCYLPEKIEVGQRIRFIPTEIKEFLHQKYGDRHFRNVYVKEDSVKIS